MTKRDAKPKTVLMAFRLPPELHDEIVERAKVEDRTVSEYLRVLLSDVFREMRQVEENAK